MNRRTSAQATLPVKNSLPIALPYPVTGTTPLLPGGTLPAASRRLTAGPARKKNGGRAQNRREPALVRDALFIVRREDGCHVVAESYYYKTEPYYRILSLENEGIAVQPSGSAVLNAYVIPICLERARTAGIPVCDWGISQAYVPLPAILYGLNYFATNDEYAVVRDNAAAKETIRHITNNGKYPFCFQKFPEGSEVCSCRSIFGETVRAPPEMATCAKDIYDLFRIPLITIVFVRTGERYSLSSLAPARYSELADAERSLLLARIADRELP